MTLDLRGITTKPALHELFKKELRFPEWYGPSWDAFWDRLVAGDPLPAEVRLINWQAFADACPRDMGILRQILEDYAREKPGKQLILS